MKKTDLIERISEQEGITKSEAKRWVEAVLSTIRDAVVVDREVSLTGVGKLRVTERPARTVRNPKTGEKVSRGPSANVKFAVSSILKKGIEGKM